MGLAADVQELEAQLDVAELDARALVDGLSEDHAAWRPSPQSWSVSECLDHLAATNRIYIGAMREPSSRAIEQAKLVATNTQSRTTRDELVEATGGHARPGLLGGWFVRSLEPPVKLRVKTPAKASPRLSPPLSDAFASFLASQSEVRAFLLEHSCLNLSSVRFQNPFVRGIRLSVATGLHVITAHERRHLWQGWNIRRQGEIARSASDS